MESYDDYISILGPSHIAYIFILFVTAFLLFRYKDFIYKYRKRFTNGILIASIFQQFILYGSYLVFYDFDLAISLPFHISRINTLIGIAFLITKNKKLFKFIMYFAVFAWLSFLYPTGVHPITHPIGVSFFMNHVITLLLPFYIMIAYKLKVDPKEKNSAFLWLIGYAIFIYFFNPLVNGNYFYLVNKPVFGFLPDVIYIPAMLVFSYILFLIIEYVYQKAEKVLI